MAPRDQRDSLVPKAELASKDHRGRQVRLAALEQPEQLEAPALKAHLAHKELLEPRDSLAELEHPEIRVLKVHRELREQLDHLVHRV